MAKHTPNPRLAKVNRNYTVEEIACLYGNHKNTIREWIKQGLPTLNEKRPMLILGSDLANFLQARRQKNKKSCQAGQLYCIRCRSPKAPAGNMAEYQRINETLGNLIAICPDCELIMNRRVNFAKLDKIKGKLDIIYPQALQRIDESINPSLNSDLK